MILIRDEWIEGARDEGEKKVGRIYEKQELFWCPSTSDDRRYDSNYALTAADSSPTLISFLCHIHIPPASSS